MPPFFGGGENTTGSSETDESLMARFKEGSEDDFNVLFDRYSSHVINFVYRFLGSREEAEDLAQEVFLRVYRAQNRYDASRPFRPWLFAIASRLVSNRLRDRKRHPLASLDQQAEGESGEPLSWQFPDPPPTRPAESLDKRDLALTVQNVLDRLPETQRMAVLLARFEEMSYEDIAQSLGTSVSAVKSLIFRARLTLKEALTPYVQSEPSQKK